MSITNSLLQTLRAVPNKPHIQRPYGTRRLFDITLAVFLLVLLSPLLFIAVMAILIQTGRPVFFKQVRTGKDGCIFEIYKLRTMTVLEDGEHVQQAVFDDERVTRIGRWLRRTSIDELPQLLNVIEGDMSLIGPRPHAVAHDKYYGVLIPEYTKRQQVKPGITGLAQVSGARGETPEISDMQRRIALDLEYVERQSLWLDLKILFLTLFAVIRSKRAY
jgi:putative colanic acid biosynthesis UDP-glucose lipid carrier transferase